MNQLSKLLAGLYDVIAKRCEFGIVSLRKLTLLYRDNSPMIPQVPPR